MNDLEAFLTMLIKTKTDFSKRTHCHGQNEKDETVTIQTDNDIQFCFENGSLRFVFNERKPKKD